MLGKSTTSRLTRSGGATPVVATGSEGASRNCCTTKAHSLPEQNPTLTYYDSYLFSLRDGGLYIKDFSLPRKCCSIQEPHISYQHVISTTYLPIQTACTISVRALSIFARRLSLQNESTSRSEEKMPDFDDFPLWDAHKETPAAIKAATDALVSNKKTSWKYNNIRST